MKYLIFLFIIGIWPFSHGNALDKINPKLLAHAMLYQSDSIVLEDLVPYLTKATSNDFEKAEIIFYWISQNIDYDFEAYYNKSYETVESNPLETRKGVCHHYATLFKAMCDIADVECYYIVGYAKGAGYSPSTPFSESNHAWNVVYIQRTYLFVDATWGSGHGIGPESNMSYVRQLNSREVLTRSAHFRSRHLPSDPMWQLTDHPITLKQFHEHTFFEDIPINSKVSFSYKQKINEYKKLSVYEQKVTSSKRIYEFLPNLEHREQAIYACYRIAYYLLQSDSNPQAIKYGMEYCKGAVLLFNQAPIKTPEMKKFSQYAKGLYYQGKGRLLSLR